MVQILHFGYFSTKSGYFLLIKVGNTVEISGFKCNEDGNEAHITSLTTGRFVFLNFLHGVSCYLIPLVFQECSTVQAISYKIWKDSKTKTLMKIDHYCQMIPTDTCFFWLSIQDWSQCWHDTFRFQGLKLMLKLT